MAVGRPRAHHLRVGRIVRLMNKPQESSSNITDACLNMKPWETVLSGATLIFVVGPDGLEPPTKGLWVPCSNQLSYGPEVFILYPIVRRNQAVPFLQAPCRKAWFLQVKPSTVFRHVRHNDRRRKMGWAVPYTSSSNSHTNYIAFPLLKKRRPRILRCKVRNHRKK